MLVASGVSYRQLTAPGFDELDRQGHLLRRRADRGARPCQDQHVVVIGGANSAGQAAVHFSRLRRQGHDARARRLAGEVDVALPDRADRRARRTSRSAPAPRRSPPTGDDHLQLAAHPRRRRRARRRTSTPRFVFIGAAPRTDWLDGRRRARRARLHPRRARRQGRRAGRSSATRTCWRRPCPGVFVAGDVRARSIKRVASAVGRGLDGRLADPRVPGGRHDRSGRAAPDRPLRRT